MRARIIALAVAALILLSITSTVAEAKGRPETPPGQKRRPETPPGHENRPEETPSGTIPAKPAAPATPASPPDQIPAIPATPATPAQPKHSTDSSGSDNVADNASSVPTEDVEEVTVENVFDNMVHELFLTDDETSMVTIWYMLMRNTYTCCDPWVFTYVQNTSGTTLFNVEFKQIVPSDLRVTNDGDAYVKRYSEEMVVSTSSSSQNYSYSFPATQTYTWSYGTYTIKRTVLGDTLVMTIDYKYSYNGRTYSGTYTYSQPATYSYSYTCSYTWSENTATVTYSHGSWSYSYTRLNREGREGTATTTYSITYIYTQSGDRINVAISVESVTISDYTQMYYTCDEYSTSGLDISTSYLDPMDQIYSWMVVEPVGEIDTNKTYSVTTQVKFTDENNKHYTVVDHASWKEPFNSFMAIGAPYIGTTTLSSWEFWQYRSMYSYPVIGGY